MASKPRDIPAAGFSVIMPFHNEVATLRTALMRLLAVDVPARLQVVLVDDGSTDGSAESIRDLLRYPRTLLLTNDRCRGKGHAVRSGLAAADGDIVGILDADLEYDPADFLPLLDAIEAGATTVAYGARPFSRHHFYSFWYMVGGRLTSRWASFLFKTSLSDIHTALKVAPRALWRSLDLRCDGFDLDSEVTGKFLKSGHRIMETPISYRSRSRAEGKKLRWTAGLASLWILTRIRVQRARVPQEFPQPGIDIAEG